MAFKWGMYEIGFVHPVVVANQKKIKQMEINRIRDEKGGIHILMPSPEIEKVNPIDYYSKRHMISGSVMLIESMKHYRIPLFDSIFKKVISKKVKEDWDEEYQKIIKTKIPENLKNIFNASRKKDQEKLLRGLSITPDILIAFLFYAWTEHGYSFSQFKAEHQRRGLDEGELPTVVYVEDDRVERVGKKSKLTDGQLKQAIEQRTVVIAKFLDKGDNWHCLFATHNSFKGEENWQNGQPHFHYISNKFGIPRDKVVESLKSRRYNLGSLPHINLTDYGNQPK